MTEVKFKGKNVSLVLNMYALRMFGKAVGEDLPSGAIEKLQALNNTQSFDAMDMAGHLFYNMAKTASEIKGEALPITLPEAYDVIMDSEAMNGMVKEINNFWPEPETLKKNKTEAAAV